jgi:hypothetical protein
MDFEKLGAFYLGKHFDIDSQSVKDQLYMYDARDLTTHAVCVGMTGSGKTGLCIGLLEEAAIDSIPAIIIDPKGDMTNLLLGFPELRPHDFRPWINQGDAERKGLSLDEFAASQSQLWKKGLGQWGQDGNRIRTLQESAEFKVYTPGSEAATPVSVLSSFSDPGLSWDSDRELLREQIQGLVQGLLGLVGIKADPIRSRESILLANILEYYWRNDREVDLGSLILGIQNPPMSKLGVFDLDTFYPKKDRFELAMTLNNILASPSFQSWIEGNPLDIPSFLTNASGKPRHSIFYIAHLNDSERMFFVTLLLNRIISWMRNQAGTTSLRALLYMDEIFGYFPPVARPPSKQPMLTLLKQARAYGLGIVLSTQNPVDLDYKGLTNAGTWFIGRLQTERDKARMLDGLSTASAGGLDSRKLKGIISGLKSRVFLAHNVHEETPSTFHTRWVMSYLRGPLTKDQLRQFRDPGEPSGRTPVRPGIDPETVGTTKLADSGLSRTPPSVDLSYYYLPVRGAVPDRDRSFGDLIYQPAVLGLGRVHYVDSRRSVKEVQRVGLLASLPDREHFVDWGKAQSLDISGDSLSEQPEPGARFAVLPDSLDDSRELRTIEKSFGEFLYRNFQLTLFYHPLFKVYSLPEEAQKDFRFRLSQKSREQRDNQIDRLNERYEKRLLRLRDRLRKAELSVERKESEAMSKKHEAVFSIGESILGMFLGRSSRRSTSSGIRKYRMSSSAGKAAEEAKETVASLQREVEALQEELTDAAGKIRQQWEDVSIELEEFAVKPRRADIELELVSLVWAPYSVTSSEGSRKSTALRAHFN